MNTLICFFGWLLLLIFCWPIALLALIAYPIVWVLLIPFRLLGIAVDSVLTLLKTILFLPARVLGYRPLEQQNECRCH
ncbi:hypothetical protein N9B57_02360 [Verrucomicrobia bacterium]|jgi:hypothetical protein|nr:hypothetical protein [Verrucomicrobiota bacterium]MDA7645092.1 hypothetical protein [bacterium]MDA7866756.1 hypothetical protein [Verrucomicrobiota bacterium]